MVDDVCVLSEGRCSVYDLNLSTYPVREQSSRRRFSSWRWRSWRVWSYVPWPRQPRAWRRVDACADGGLDRTRRPGNRSTAVLRRRWSLKPRTGTRRARATGIRTLRPPLPSCSGTECTRWAADDMASRRRRWRCRRWDAWRRLWANRSETTGTWSSWWRSWWRVNRVDRPWYGGLVAVRGGLRRTIRILRARRDHCKDSGEVCWTVARDTKATSVEVFGARVCGDWLSAAVRDLHAAAAAPTLPPRRRVVSPPSSASAAYPFLVRHNPLCCVRDPRGASSAAAPCLYTHILVQYTRCRPFNIWSD